MSGILRVWKELDLKDVEDHLIVVGDLCAECFSCHQIDLDKKAVQCPHCGAQFKYMGFRRRIDIGYMRKIKQELSHLVFIDFDDFKKNMGKSDARKLLDI